MRSVALSEWLRPWLGAGVTAFLSEYPVDMAQLSPDFSPAPLRSHPSSSSSSPYASAVPSHAPAPAAGGGGARGGRPDFGHSGPARRSFEASSAKDSALLGDQRMAGRSTPPQHDTPGQQGQGARYAVAQGDASPHKRGEQGETQKSTSMGQVTSGALPEALAREHWPKEFQAYFQRLSPSPVVWCYEALGDDLFGQSDQQRSDCLKKLIGELHFPKGTSVFWPPSIPKVADTAISQQVCLQALQELFPKLIICLGSGPVLSFLRGADEPLPFTQRLVKGHMVVFLPDFKDLIANTSLFNQSVLYLRAIVSQLFII